MNDVLQRHQQIRMKYIQNEK